MKVLYCAAAAALVALCTAASAQAQIAEEITFTTAFPFAVGKTMLPAGSYTIRPMEVSPSILEITNRTVAVLVPTENVVEGQAHAKPEVVFKRQGDHYALSEVRDADSGAHVQAGWTE